MFAIHILQYVTTVDSMILSFNGICTYMYLYGYCVSSKSMQPDLLQTSKYWYFNAHIYTTHLMRRMVNHTVRARMVKLWLSMGRPRRRSHHYYVRNKQSNHAVIYYTFSVVLNVFFFSRNVLRFHKMFKEIAPIVFLVVFFCFCFCLSSSICPKKGKNL